MMDLKHRYAKGLFVVAASTGGGPRTFEMRALRVHIFQMQGGQAFCSKQENVFLSPFSDNYQLYPTK